MHGFAAGCWLSNKQNRFHSCTAWCCTCATLAALTGSKGAPHDMARSCCAAASDSARPMEEPGCCVRCAGGASAATAEGTASCRFRLYSTSSSPIILNGVLHAAAGRQQAGQQSTSTTSSSGIHTRVRVLGAAALQAASRAGCSTCGSQIGRPCCRRRSGSPPQLQGPPAGRSSCC